MIQSIDRAAKIMNLLRGARRLGIGELATALELPPSTVHGLVKSLQAHGLVTQERNSNRYALGPALVKLSSVYLDTLDVRAHSIRWMHDLSQRTGLATRLGVPLRDEVLVIHHDRRPDGSEQMPETGLTIPAHASALGKILLAYDDELAREVANAPLTELTAETITDLAALRSELKAVRENALAYENEEAVVGESSIAAPVSGETGAVIAAVAIVLPSIDGPVKDAVLHDLRESARSISRVLGTPNWPPSTHRS